MVLPRHAKPDCPLAFFALSLVLPACGVSAGVTADGPAPSKRDLIVAAGGGHSVELYSTPYIKGCDDYVALLDPKVKGALDAAAGVSKSVAGAQHEQASAVLTKLVALKVAPYVNVPQKGFPMVKTAIQDQIVAQTKGGTAADPKKMMALAQKFSQANPYVLELNSQLYEIYMAYIQSSVFAQVASAYPLAAAVAMGNAAHQGVIPDDRDAMKTQVKAIMLASQRVQARGAIIMGLYAEYQAAVPGAVPPSSIDDTIVASRASLDAAPEVTDAQVDEVMALADQAVAAAQARQAELRALSQQTLRPSPGKASGDAIQSVDKGNKVSSVIGLLGSIATGNVMGIVQNAAALVPNDNPLGAAIAGAACIAKGDFKGALENAAKVAPNTSIGRAITTVATVTKQVTSVVDAAKGV